MRLITLDEYLMGRDRAYADEYNEVIAQNAAQTVEKINEFLRASGFDGHVNSGWRPAAVNGATLGAAPHSKHMSALACDLLDGSEKLDEWCSQHPEQLEALNLWRESPARTLGWLHLQTVQYGSWESGKSRTFVP